MSKVQDRDQAQLLLAPMSPGQAFTRIRNYLAGRFVGATRDVELLEQVLLCVVARLVLREGGLIGEVPAQSIRTDYLRALRKVTKTVGSLLPKALVLDPECLRYVDSCLTLVDFTPTQGDLVGDAYQCFVGSDARGQEGQFFTPAVAVKALVEMIDPQPGERIIDPACGAGGFLFAAATQLLRRGVESNTLASALFGIDKDERLARLANLRLALLTWTKNEIFVGDSLAWTSPDEHSFMRSLGPASFDVVLTNPPFGARIVAASDAVRRGFTLAHRWKQNERGQWVPTDELLPSAPPQMLFVERCLELVRPEGRVGIVVPESLVSGSNYRHVVEYLLARADINAVIGMPEALFKTSGKGGTHTKTVLLALRKRGRHSRQSRPIFMAEAAWCGHDSRGRHVPRDDVSTILRNYTAWRSDWRSQEDSELGFTVRPQGLRPGVLSPRSYDARLDALLARLEKSHHLVSIGKLLEEGTISITSGDEVGKLAYGTGTVPFVRTSDLANWEIKADPKHGVSREIYEALRPKQDVQPLDILMVRDGTYLIGTCALVTKQDAEIVYQSHIYKIRVNTTGLLDTFLLLAVLSSPIVQRQIKMHTQTQDIINSLGSRINAIVLPIPRDEGRRREVAQLVEAVVRDRAQARALAREAVGLLTNGEPICDTY